MEHVMQVYTIVATLVGLLGALYARISKKKQMPAWLQTASNLVGQERVFRALEHAETFMEASPEERRVLAADYLKQIVRDELQYELPTSIANSLVEIFYQAWKAIRR